MKLRRNREGALFLFLTFLLLVSTGCRNVKTDSANCISCHRKIEPVSISHPSCISCHSGNPAGKSSDKAHRGMFGPRNPADPAFWDKSCGPCHYYQLGRVKSTIMQTNAGMIRNIQLSWEGEDGRNYSATGGNVFDSRGNALEYRPVAELDNLSGELYRKFCSRCHVGIENGDASSAGHASGCAACHFPFNDTATYKGNDATVHGKSPYSASHKMTPLPGNDVCFRCHNRSGRIALSYQGLYDGNNSLVPTRNGLPGPVMASGNRNLTHIAPDVHFAAGMECIDCHTSRDVMGDGYAYRNMYLQTEIRCEDCHGTPTAPPRHRPISRENEEAVRESKSYKQMMRPGMEMVLTAKGRPYSNVFHQAGRIYVLGKRSGKIFTSKVISGTPEHLVAGHRRLECYSCHSRTVVQCYGCHTTYDRTAQGMDFIRKKETPGDFSETEDYRTLYPFPLAVNQRGRISPVTPGCQTFITVIEADGSRSREEYVARFKGKRQLRFAPFYSHNTGKKAVTCGECHGDPAFLGFGQHVVAGNSISGTLLCEKSDSKPLDGFLTMQKGKVTAYSAITRENSRPLNGREVRRVLAVNLCLVCHDKAKDPIYRKELDYRALDDTLHRRLFDGR
ncbi:MAG: hypothetical protein FD174_1330 [Geobacteraceae bacterium]|nr:MAG: hypothetical protein FD174_1330 [Geobacteraceae bacterium]